MRVHEHWEGTDERLVMMRVVETSGRMRKLWIRWMVVKQAEGCEPSGVLWTVVNQVEICGQWKVVRRVDGCEAS